MILALTLGWCIAIVGGTFGTLGASALIGAIAGKTLSTSTVDELEARRLQHLAEQEQRRDDSGGGAA